MKPWRTDCLYASCFVLFVASWFDLFSGEREAHGFAGPLTVHVSPGLFQSFCAASPGVSASLNVTSPTCPSAKTILEPPRWRVLRRRQSVFSRASGEPVTALALP